MSQSSFTSRFFYSWRGWSFLTNDRQSDWLLSEIDPSLAAAQINLEKKSTM